MCWSCGHLYVGGVCAGHLYVGGVCAGHLYVGGVCAGHLYVGGVCAGHLYVGGVHLYVGGVCAGHLYVGGVLFSSSFSIAGISDELTMMQMAAARTSMQSPVQSLVAQSAVTSVQHNLVRRTTSYVV